MLTGPAHWRLDPQPVLIADRTVRFRDPAHRASPLPPFPAYLTQPIDLAPAPADLPIRPRFTNRSGLRHAHIPIAPGTSLYGTGEIAGPLRRNGKVTVCWNTDNFDYTDASRSLYQSHPFVLAVHRDGSASGVICETTHWCRIDLRRGILFSARGHSPAITLIHRDSPDQVVQALADLTGKMPMPPRWALGYQQCRWSYEPDARVREIAQGFRERRIPCDVIWLDIDYMNGFRCFTFDHAKFPDPGALNHHLHSIGFKNVSMIDPGIKVDPSYFVYDQGRSRPPVDPSQADRGDSDLAPWADAPPSSFVRNSYGIEHHGSVWPGPCAFPDFTNRHVRAWWAGLYKDFLSTGIDGVWNDMNEPAIFDGPGKSMPVSCLHAADDDLGGPDTHARYHNIYGMEMVRATREGMSAARPGERIFVLTRSNFLGGQRYAATWTGDNRSDWNHLAWSIPMVLNLSLSGQPFAGPDIGGFVGNATPDLFARFMGIGSLLPFARGHSVKDSRDHEPWSFGPDCQEACRLALVRRYRLIPYLYTQFHRAATEGTPIVRPVWFADPSSPLLRSIDHAFLLGPDLLVVASVDPHNPAPPDSPLPSWREIEIASPAISSSPSARAHVQLPRLFIRPGAIIPLAPHGAMHTGELAMTRLTLLVAPDAHNAASGFLYNDDGHSTAYQHGASEQFSFTYVPCSLAVRVDAIHEGIARTAGFEEVEILNPSDTPQRGSIQP